MIAKAKQRNERLPRVHMMTALSYGLELFERLLATRFQLPESVEHFILGHARSLLELGVVPDGGWNFDVIAINREDARRTVRWDETTWSW